MTATRTGAVNGPPSDPPATATTTAAPTPAQVSGVVASALSDAEVSVSWSPAPNATAYVVEWRPDGESHAGDRRAVVMGTEVVIEDLESETDYFIRVFGTRKGAANGDASAEDTAVTLESAIKSAIKRFPGGNEIAMQLSLVGLRRRSVRCPVSGQEIPATGSDDPGLHVRRLPDSADNRHWVAVSGPAG